MEKTGHSLGSLALVLIGGILDAAAFGLVVLPQGFVVGGVTGLSVIVSKVVPAPVSAVVLALNLAFLAMAWLLVGRSFAERTVLLSIAFPVLLSIFQAVPTPALLAANPAMSALVAGVTAGVGVGLVLVGHGSSGGFDVIGVILNKKFNLSVSIVMLVLDVSVILAQVTTASLSQLLCGILTVAGIDLTVNVVLSLSERLGDARRAARENARAV